MENEQQEAAENLGGRPSLYKPEFAEVAYKLCLLGHTDKELADFFEVCEATVNNWKKDYPEFLESIKGGKQVADANVSQSLYKRAVGYRVTEVHKQKVGAEVLGLEVGEEGLKAVPTGEEFVLTKVIEKEILPDVTAQIFWLKNRQKSKWRDKQEHGITDAEGNDVGAPNINVYTGQAPPLASSESEIDE